jgi:LPS O-antigen subunit length determinant protein (WzzB/FepE family)
MEEKTKEANIGGMLGVLIVFVRAFIRSDQSQPDK